MLRGRDGRGLATPSGGAGAPAKPRTARLPPKSPKEGTFGSRSGSIALFLFSDLWVCNQDLGPTLFVSFHIPWQIPVFWVSFKRHKANRFSSLVYMVGIREWLHLQFAAGQIADLAAVGF